MSSAADFLVTADKFEAFKNLTAGLQSIATIFALVLAGIWALRTWKIQRRDLLKSLFPAVEITISAKPADLAKESQISGLLIRGDITIKNIGTQATILQLTERDQNGNPNYGPIIVCRVNSIENNRMQFGDENRFWLHKPPSPGRLDIEQQDEIRPQATDHYEFFAPVSKPGLYIVMFSSSLDKKEVDRMRDEGVDMSNWKWEVTTFVEVM